MNKIGRLVRKYIFGVSDEPMLETLKKQGLIMGDNCSIMGECIIDPGHCWLIKIGNNSTILPDVRIGNNSIIGANSLVSKNVPENCVYGGNPARFICTTDDYYRKIEKLMSKRPRYDYSYTAGSNIDDEMKRKMVSELQDGIGFVE